MCILEMKQIEYGTYMASCSFEHLPIKLQKKFSAFICFVMNFLKIDVKLPHYFPDSHAKSNQEILI